MRESEIGTVKDPDYVPLKGVSQKGKENLKTGNKNFCDRKQVHP